MQSWRLSQYRQQVLDAAVEVSDTRRYNRWIVDQIEAVCGVRGKRIVDLGCSAYGFTLERALELGAREFYGVDLVASPACISTDGACGYLLPKSAYDTGLPDSQFDIALTISTLGAF